MDRNGRVVGDIVKGALSGAAATWLMTQATTWMYEHEGDEAKQREQAGLAIHWATGIGAGIVYALLRRRAPRRLPPRAWRSAPDFICSSTSW